MRLSPLTLSLLLAVAACAPTPPVAAPAPSMPVATPPVVTEPAPEVPVLDVYRAAQERGTRTATGAPGASYWQNHASYQIEAELEPRASRIRGSERIVYENRSPTELTSIVLNLYQNIFTESVPRNRYAPVTGGVTLERVIAQGQMLGAQSTSRIPISRDVQQAPAGYSVQGTLARVRLPRPVPPGGTVTLEIDWTHVVPPANAFRTAWEDALGSRAFLVAQWYPQIAAYDDLRGWDATPYLGDGEFYLDYADFEVSLAVPAGFLVGATGDLLNAEEVLTEEAIARLDAAMRSDSITAVVTDADLSAENATQPSLGGQHVWRFRAENVRDFAFATSNGYVWDVARAAIPTADGGTRYVPIHSFYRPGAPNWERSARHGEHALRTFSEIVAPYPYSHMTIAEGPVTGMEYPMITFIYRPLEEFSLYSVIAHEIAHEWFPMMVGQNEAEFAWMDEGMATYLEGFAVGDFFDIDDPLEPEVAYYLSVAGSDVEVPLMRHTDLVSPYGARTVAAYSKPGVLFRSLDDLLGGDGFRRALRSYASEWAGRHPTPWDFFSTVERFNGEPLDWFFVPWWFETGALDQAIASVEVGESGTVVTVRNDGDAIAPAPLVATTASGETLRGRIEASSWVGGAAEATASFPGRSDIVRVEIDPDRIYPDVDLENNVWEGP